MKGNTIRIAADWSAILAASALAISLPAQESTSNLAHAIEFGRQRLRATANTVSTTAHPRSAPAGAGSVWRTSDSAYWTSGFFTGLLWLMYEHTGDAFWKTRAKAQMGDLEREKTNGSNHDVGFKIMTSFGQAQRLAPRAEYANVIITAAETLASRYMPAAGAIQSQAARYIGTNLACLSRVWVNRPVIIDNMMNLELLFYASHLSGDPKYRTIAISHALKTSEQHVRVDGSTWQYVDFDSSGAVVFKGTHQGYCDDTTWSRGQAWAIYGFAMAYRYTGDGRFLETSRKTADFFIDHLLPDHVPFWDFQLPNPTGEPRDSSAATAILHALSASPYLAEGSGSPGLTLHATANRNTNDDVDVTLIYADYYFIEALMRYEPADGTASVALGDLSHTYDGTPKPATVTTLPSPLSVTITYHGATDAPTNVGSYAVVATVTDPSYHGSATGTLTIAPAVPVSQSLRAVADAHVQGGSSASKNFGRVKTLEVKEAPAETYDRRAFLRFRSLARAADDRNFTPVRRLPPERQPRAGLRSCGRKRYMGRIRNRMEQSPDCRVDTRPLGRPAGSRSMSRHSPGRRHPAID